MAEKHNPKPGILLHAASQKHSKGRAMWNEDNLAENDKIKATLNPVKITEPKTPFHELLPDDDIDVEPLDLDGDTAGWPVQPMHACRPHAPCMHAHAMFYAATCLFLHEIEIPINPPLCVGANGAAPHVRAVRSGHGV